MKTVCFSAGAGCFNLKNPQDEKKIYVSLQKGFATQAKSIH